MDAKSEEVESIAQSAKVISMLHKNLNLYLNDIQFEKEKFLPIDIASLDAFDDELSHKTDEVKPDFDQKDH